MKISAELFIIFLTANINFICLNLINIFYMRTLSYQSNNYNMHEDMETAGEYKKFTIITFNNINY